MKLSPQQIAAAKARGFVLFPASQSQIDRMTMQRRIFDVDGRPHVVSRDGVYFETHATLAPTIADASQGAMPEPAAAPMPAPPPAEEPAPEPAVAEDEAVAEADAAPAASETLALPGLGAEPDATGEEPRRRRARAAEAPRWQVAGAIRRGRQPRA